MSGGKIKKKSQGREWWGITVLEVKKKEKKKDEKKKKKNMMCAREEVEYPLLWCLCRKLSDCRNKDQGREEQKRKGNAQENTLEKTKNVRGK